MKRTAFSPAAGALVILVLLLMCSPALAANQMSIDQGAWTKSRSVSVHISVDDALRTNYRIGEGLRWSDWTNWVESGGPMEWQLDQVQGVHTLLAEFDAGSPTTTSDTIRLDWTKPTLSAKVKPNPCPSSPSVQPWVRGRANDNMSPSGQLWAVVKTLKGKRVGDGGLVGWKHIAGGHSFRFILWRSQPPNYTPRLFRPGRYRVYVKCKDRAGNVRTVTVPMRIT